jgi:hypothetical protein
MTRPPSSNDLKARLPFDAQRAAVDTIRGFDWQRWLTVRAWLNLRADEAMWIEWGEDFTVASAGGMPG